jgi:O-antigen/teichoic acid export membrane protein
MSAPRRHLGAGAALSVVVQGGPLLAAGVLSVVLARKLGPSGNGDFARLATLAGIASLLVSLGLTAGIVYEVSRRRWSVAHAFRTTYAAAFVLGTVGALAGLGVFVLTRDTVFKGIGTVPALIALSSLPPVLAYQYADAILLARERYEGYAALEIAHSGTLLLVGAGLALPFGLTGALIGLPAAAVAGAVLGTLLLTREALRDTVVAVDGEPLPSALRFGLQSWGANLLQQINYRFDLLILGGFAASSDVGVYSIALTLTSIAWVLPQALQTVLFPRVASLDESTLTGEISTEESDAALAKAVRHSVLLTIPAGVLISLLLLFAVPLVYGSAFADTRKLGFVLLPGVLLLGIGKVLGTAVAGRGYPRYTLYIGAISMPVTLSLYFALIPPFHAWGAAIASSISYGFSAILSLVFFRRVTGVRMRDALVPLAQDVADYGGVMRLARGWRPGRG